MTMKKLIASVITGAVAVSAMATSAFAVEYSQTFNTYKTTTSYSGEATFTGIVTTQGTDVVVTLPTEFVNADSIKVTALTLAGKEVDEDAIELYADEASGVVTINTISVASGEVLSFSVEATDTDATKTTFDDKSIAAPANISGTPLFTSSTKATNTKNYMAVPKNLTDIATSYPLIDVAITNYIADNAGAKLIVNFKDMEAADEATTEEKDPTYSQDITFSSTTTADDLGIMINGTSKLSKAASIDPDALTVTFDWDTLLADSGITNAIGEINSIELVAANDLVAKYDSDDDGTDDSDKYVITGFTVVKGEAAATTEAPTTEAPADDDTTTTPADENPDTGAAPVALALIPAALAAVVVAKKRK